MSDVKHRAFLKWAGGKFSLVDKISQQLPKTKILAEPFVGAGSVFLNTDHEQYLLNDINADLINLFKILQQDPTNLIAEARAYFKPEFNEESQFYALRERFNKCEDVAERSVLFLYLNRHCYNGLCRYNKSGGFNVPFGRYKKPYFPETELKTFAQKAQRAVFTSLPFDQFMANVSDEAAIYCDPPYAPVSDTAYFTSYAKQGFDPEQQELLASLAKEINQERGIFVMISNHDTEYTRKIYQGAEIEEVWASRFISQNVENRNKVSELFAIYK